MRLVVECKCGERWFSNDSLRQNPDIMEICPRCFDEDNVVVEAHDNRASYIQQAAEVAQHSLNF
jgi:hypothetical protein